MTGARRIYRFIRGDDSEVRQAAGDFQQRYEALTPAEQAELQRLIAEVEPRRDGRRALSVNDLPALLKEAKRRANPPDPDPDPADQPYRADQPYSADQPYRAGRPYSADQSYSADQPYSAGQPYSAPDPPPAGQGYAARPYQWRSPRPRPGLSLGGLRAVLAAVGFALIFGAILWSHTGQLVEATNQSCTPSPPRCVVSWQQDGAPHTDEIGPSNEKGAHRSLSPGGVNFVRVRNGHVVGGLSWPVAVTGVILVAAGTSRIRRRRR